jgi:hypothetical protein
VDQQLAKIAISSLGNPDETGLAACPYIFRRHQPNVMPLNLEQTAKMMGAAAGFHGDDAGRKTFSEPNDAGRPHAPPLDDFALTIQPHEAAAVLAKINSENCNLHPTSPAPSNRQPQ